MYLLKNALDLVGRSQELERLHTQLHQAQQAHGQAVLIVGEAGIGKTRLLGSLIGLAQKSSFAVIRGECNEQDQDFPYAPIIDGLRSHFSRIASEEVLNIISPFQQELVRLLPELAPWLETTPPAVSLEPEAEKRRLFEILIQIYHRLTTSGLLLIFEDIHWSDANSLEFFQTLTRRISALPIMVAISSRLSASTTEVGKLQWYFERADNAQSITLNPLTEAEIENLIKAALQTTDAIHPGLLERLNVLSQGNPLYTEQLIYMLQQKRQINLVNGTWMITTSTQTVEIPTTIAQTIEQQMERLSSSERDVLQMAAVMGQQFELTVLQQLTALDEMSLTGLVKELIRKRFFEELSQDRFAFRHALLRQAIYDGLLIRERQALHQSILRIFEESASTQPDSLLSKLSYHAYQAQAWEAARQYGFQAGQHALLLHSPHAAVEHFSHAIEAASYLGDPIAWELMMQRGNAFDNLGEFQAALDDYETALDIAESCGEQEAAWQLLIAIALLWSARDYRQAEDYCQRALKMAQELEEPRLIGHSLNRLGNWYLNIGKPYEALHYHEQALAVFEELDHLPGKGETLDLLGMTSGHVLQLRAQLDYYQEAVMIFRTLDERKTLASTLANLALCTLQPPLAEEAITIAHQIDWYSGEAYACLTAGFVHSFYGHFRQSLSYLQRSQELAQAINHSQWLAGTHVFSGFIYKDLLDLETAADQTDKGITLAAAVGSHWYSEMGRGLLARIRIEQGQLDAAAEILAQGEVPDPPAMQHLPAMMAEAELLLARGDAQAAFLSNERLGQVWSIERESVPLSVFVAVPYLINQAKAQAIIGRDADSLELLQRVRYLCQENGLLPALWQVEVLLGHLAAQQQDEETALICYQRAHAVIRQLAENVPADMRQRFLKNAEKLIQSDTKLRKSIISHHQLTGRETEIVREVALGKTNQQIANDLHVTVKTVEAHITRILSKLNLTSRTQVALWAVENKLTIPPDSP